MGVSALFTAARFRAIEIAAELVVSDELFTLTRNPGEMVCRVGTELFTTRQLYSY